MNGSVTVVARTEARELVHAREGDALPELLDCAKLSRELGITRAAAEAIMRRVPKVEPEGLRKVYVRRADVVRYLESVTRA